MSECIEQSISNKDISDKRDYTFFVAGHAYGSPTGNNVGLYPLFYNDISKRVENAKISFGVLTGDVVRNASMHSWKIVKNQIKDLSIPVYIAAGNHDIGNGVHNAKRDIYNLENGESYYTFKKNGDLFITLDPNIEGWNIVGQQLEFLKQTIKENKGANNTIFVFMHQLIWADKTKNQFLHAIPNSFAGKSHKQTNYWKSIAPLFEQLPNNVYIISGDVGAFDNNNALFCTKKKNIIYVTSGMGGGVHDNYLLFNVRDSVVSVKVIRLNKT